MHSSFLHQAKPALRAVGITLVLLFLSAVLLQVTSVFGDAQARVVWIAQLLGQSPLLLIGLLCLLLSLSEHWESLPRYSGEPMPGKRDGLLLRLRVLVLVLASLYLAIVPFTLFNVLTIRSRGVIALERQLSALQTQQAQLRQALNANAGSMPSAELLKRYPSLVPAGTAPRPIAFYLDRLNQSELDLRQGAERRRRDADADLTRRYLSIAISAILHGVVFLYIWRYWPSYPRRIDTPDYMKTEG